MASPRSKDTLRREVYLLKQLQSLYAWRGSLVDTVIEKLIVPGINSKNLPSEHDVITFSMKLMDKQIEFGKERKYRFNNITKSDAGEVYCAFYDVEYNGGLDEEALQEAREDVIISLKNLMRSKFLGELVEKSLYVIAQRPLIFKFEKTPVSGTPDLLVFYPDKPPLITDWKVHSSLDTDSWLQLGIYAITLSRTKPHKDFPNGIETWIEDPTTFQLVEYQLLMDKQKEHRISYSDVADIEDYIFESINQINNLLSGKKYGEIDINNFPTTRYPDICVKCQFKKLCWRRNWYDPY